MENSEKGQALKQEILEDARKKAKRTLDKADKEKTGILDKADKEAEKLAGDLLAEAERSALIQANKISAGTGLEIKKMRLERIHAFLEEVAEAGLQRMEQLDQKQAKPLLESALDEAFERLQHEELELHVAPGTDQALLTKACKQHKRKANIVEEDNLSPGELVVLVEDGARRFEARYRGMYRADKEQLLRRLYTGLFGGDHG